MLVVPVFFCEPEDPLNDCRRLLRKINIFVRVDETIFHVDLGGPITATSPHDNKNIPKYRRKRWVYIIY